ncbi:MAG: type II secretion system protein [Phycisphaeraceae bacterium]
MRVRPLRGFTLIELLVVISIIALLIAILLPALGKARASAGAVVCMSNTAQMAKANEMFADENHEHYPYNYWLGDGSEWVKRYQAGSRQRVVYWMVDPIFLSYLGFTDEQVNNATRGGNANQTWGAQWPDDYLCPQWEDNNNAFNHRNSYGYSRGRRGNAVNVAHRPKIPDPDEAYGFMDAAGWHLQERMADYKKLWDARGNNAPDSQVNYRHDESVNVSYFDGHVARVHKSELFFYTNGGNAPDKERNAKHWTLQKK